MRKEWSDEGAPGECHRDRFQDLPVQRRPGQFVQPAPPAEFRQHRGAETGRGAVLRDIVHGHFVSKKTVPSFQS